MRFTRLSDARDVHQVERSAVRGGPYANSAMPSVESDAFGNFITKIMQLVRKTLERNTVKLC